MKVSRLDQMVRRAEARNTEESTNYGIAITMSGIFTSWLYSPTDENAN
jgi:hypothetical protein